MHNKELKEVLVGFVALAGLLAEEFKDGIQASDIADIFLKIESNEDLKAKLVLAYNDINKVPSEIKEMSMAESIDLVVFAIPEIVKLIGSIKK